LPPSATVPVYKEKVFVKALRLPQHLTSFKFKNDEFYNTNKQTVKQEKQNTKQ
jgi:hypothetical protein